MSDDRLIEFEEDNFDYLVEKFLRLKTIVDAWGDFVYEQYEDSLKDAPDGEDR